MYNKELEDLKNKIDETLKNALPKRTHLKNKRSGNIATITDVFPTLDESTNWVSIPGYHICFFGMRYQYINHNDLNKWEIITEQEYETAFNQYYYGKD
jgi:hypothetical protein